MAKRVTNTETQPMELQITPPKRASLELMIIGETPLIYNSVSQKAKRQLLAPSGRMNNAEKAESIKHDPLAEYRESVYRWDLPHAPTRLMVPATFFKGAMLEAALRIRGVTKAEIGQVVWVAGDRDLHADKIAIYGTPQLRMDVVRQAGINHAPDIRTRATLSRWCCKFTLRYLVPLLTATSVVNLLGTSGMICGVGDFRQGKGKGSYGQFQIIDPSDAEAVADWNAISLEGREAQDAALADPECYDHETESLYSWFQTEIVRRGRADAITLADGKRADKAPASLVAASRKGRRANGASQGHPA